MTDHRGDHDAERLAIHSGMHPADDLEGIEDPGQDMDLVIEYLQGKLDSGRVALVKQRLSEDPAFLEFASPLIWAWTATTDPRDVPPVTREELEMRWDEFTKRAGFIHQRRRTKVRRLRLLGIVLLALATGGWFTRDALGAWYHDRRDFVAVKAVGEWVTVGENAEARLAPGAALRVSRVVPDTGTDVSKLVGAAEFRVTRQRTNYMLKRAIRAFSVSTPAGVVATVRGTFTVRTAGDTTFVHVHKPDVEELLGFTTLATTVYVHNRRGDAVVLEELQRARLVKDQPPEVLP